MNTLPTPKPARKRRWPLRLAAFALAGSALFAAYWFTRPPELVWWTSPVLDAKGHRIKILVPDGWKSARFPLGTYETLYHYRFSPRDNRPLFVSWLMKDIRERASLHLGVRSMGESGPTIFLNEPSVDVTPEMITADCKRGNVQARIVVTLYYARSSAPAFNRTYKLICNSLTIE